MSARRTRLTAKAMRPNAISRGANTVEPIASVTVTSTEAQNEFGRILDQASHDAVVVITRHTVPRAVLLSIGRYRELAGAQATMLNTLTEEFDAQFDRMQDPQVWASTERGFQATPVEMGQAALTAARRHRG